MPLLIIITITPYPIFKLRTNMFINSEIRPGSFNICLDIVQIGVGQFNKIFRHTFFKLEIQLVALAFR